MDKELIAYVKVYEGWLDPAHCDQAAEELGKANWQQHYFVAGSSPDPILKSGNKELDTSWDVISVTPYIMQRTWEAYKRYTAELSFPWFDGWDGFSQVRYNRYLEERTMALHCDHITSMFDGTRKGVPTMTCLSVLNDGYEGGEFIMFGDTKVDMPKGATVVFPSCFLYPHMVTPVTKGIRYSCVSWAW